MATLDPTEAGYFKSSFCNSGACVEVAVVVDAVRMRDGKAPDEPGLSFSRESWAAFVGGVKARQFDRP